MRKAAISKSEVLSGTLPDCGATVFHPLIQHVPPVAITVALARNTRKEPVGKWMPMRPGTRRL